MSVHDRTPRLWTLWKAARPSQLALIGLVYALGVGMALVGRPWPSVEGVVLAAGAVGTVAASVHYANEYADVETDSRTDRTAFSGGSGALGRTGLDRALLARASTVALIVGLAIGLAGWTVGLLSTTALGVLAVIALAGLGYSLEPVAFVRRGVGEVVNAVLGGFLLPLYGVAVVGQPTVAEAVALVPFVCLVGCNLLATHWPDRTADAAVGKRTLAVRWPANRLRQAYWMLAVAAALFTGATVGWALPVPVVAGQALTLPILVWGGVVLTRRRSPFPAVAAMVSYAAVTALAWWWLAVR